MPSSAGPSTNSGSIAVTPGAPGTNTQPRSIRANVTNEDKRHDQHRDRPQTSNGCDSGGTWINHGTITTSRQYHVLFQPTPAPAFSLTQAGGTFVNNGRTIVNGAITHSGGTTTGNPLQVCGNLDASGPGAASFEIIGDPNYCGGGRLTADIGSSDTVFINNTDPASSSQLVVTTPRSPTTEPNAGG